MIGKSGERGSGISVLVARQDDDDGLIVSLLFFYKDGFDIKLPTKVGMP